MGKLAEAAVEKLRAERDQTLRNLLPLTEDECLLPAQWANTQRTVNFLLRAFTSHQLDHLQQFHRLLHEQGRGFSGAEVLLTKAQGLQGEIEAMMLSLSDEEFLEAEAKEGGWSAKDLIEHISEVERHYREEILRSLEQAKSGAGTAS